MKPSSTETLERIARRIPILEPAYERMLRRRDRKRRNQRIAAGVVGIAVFVAAVWVVTTGGPFERTQTPVAPGTTGEPSFAPTPPAFDPHIATAPWVTRERADVDFVLDLNTGETTPLPETILQALAPIVREDRYAASPDGRTLALVGLGDGGTHQIFIARLDGTSVRQVTHDPIGAISPAWSPEGDRIVYEGHADGGVTLFVLDVATGEATKVIDVPMRGAQPTFTPDGTGLVYNGGSNTAPVLRTVPLAGGKSTILVESGEGIGDSGNGTLSPDGSLVTFLGSGTPASGEVGHCGPCRFLADADGTDKRVIVGWVATPAGMWSPDGSRIVAMEKLGASEPQIIVVVDVSTETATHVANGETAIWLDNHTLLVEV
jgi:Tol biopolymer transport system component